MKARIFATLLGVATLLNAEISVFDAGNLNSENPYGLTENEKILLKNNKKVENLKQNVGDVEARLNNTQESVQGIQSIIEGANRRIIQLESRIAELENRLKILDLNLSSEVSKVDSYAKSSRNLQDANHKKVLKALSELTNLIDSINQTPQAKPKAQTSSKSPAEMMNEAEKLFAAKKYQEAKPLFENLVSKNHKPARSNFMLGEIEYFSQNYKEAIEFYKISVGLSDKADYMPKLLYHTAISFDKIGDQGNANKFYQALKGGYPNSKEAQASPNRK